MRREDGREETGSFKVMPFVDGFLLDGEGQVVCKDFIVSGLWELGKLKEGYAKGDYNDEIYDLKFVNFIGTGTVQEKNVYYLGGWKIRTLWNYIVFRHGWGILKEENQPQYEGLFDETDKHGVFEITDIDGTVSYKLFKFDEFVQDMKKEDFKRPE